MTLTSPTHDGFYTFPPGSGRGARWIARTVGGTHDPDPIIADGVTRAAALKLARAMRRWPPLR